MPARLNLWVYDEFLKRLDRWRRAQDNPPTRSVALKRMAERGMDEVEREMGVVPLGNRGVDHGHKESNKAKEELA